ncbi:MAG: thioesterase family protein [candidate division KSB1 bacterium]|nr:thioesterase family protein [candidate division KSB1 bacterium]
MPRVELQPLREYQFSTDLAVRVTDLNYGGHLGNDRLLALVHEARVAFLASQGWSEKNCGGVSLIMGDAAIVYQGQAYAGDTLRFEVAMGEPSRCGFRLFYRVTRVSDGKPVALVETGMICFDYTTQKVRPLPTEVRTACA